VQDPDVRVVVGQVLEGPAGDLLENPAIREAYLGQRGDAA
jgi:ABC-type lipopolysaccharide export system ATPase subunit